MSTSYNSGTSRISGLFPESKDQFNPHLALCDVAKNIVHYSKSFEDAKRIFRNIIDKGGMGFEYSCGIHCSYDQESMHELGIEPFSDYERCVVGTHEREFVWTVYSLEELEGWLTLLAISTAEKLNKEWKRPLLAMLDRRFDTQKRISELHRKLSGEIDWTFGPVAAHATSEYLKSWKAMHNEKLAEGYFECINNDFLTHGLILPNESESTLSCSPSKESLFPTSSQFENPHVSLVQTLDPFLYLYKDTDKLIADLNMLLDGSDCNFYDHGNIWSNFDSKWMSKENIAPFKTGDYYIVNSIDQSTALWYAYSKAELKGWISLLVLKLEKKRIRNRKQKIDELIRPKIDIIDSIKLIRRKLSGQEAWDLGLTGQSVTTKMLERWNNLHHKELDEDIFYHNNYDWIKTRR